MFILFGSSLSLQVKAPTFSSLTASLSVLVGIVDMNIKEWYILITVLVEIVRSQIQSIEVAPRSLHGSDPMATAFIEFDTY